ncbi:PREDICTED: cell division cycle-associated protein 2 isoform X2 [Pseudopodoces humilis]|uniref:cell division cycle-associated protein 2 isoform X2 n=1 Tax=Pseudopodoces humilis TaxID=181119 RepID=UPI0006B87CB1|nr:PREDICTED: cell division cycle-associated protein 2 isoform X2 [Pseudopodoces humilis]
MLRGSKTPLKVKENERGCPEQKEEASFPPLRDQKSCKVTKPKGIRPSKKENFTDGNQTQPPKRVLKCPEENLCQPQGVDVSWQLPGRCFGALRGDVPTELPLPLHTKGDFSSSQAVPLGNDFSTPERDKVEAKPDFRLSEERNKPVDFAAVVTAEFGISRENVGKRPTGTSPTSLKFRRRSTVGLRGSPENNTLIRYLAQQRSSRQKEAFTQISPFKPANVRSLKDKMEAFQACFESLQEAEGEAGLSHLGEPFQEGGSSLNKAPLNKEPNLEQWREKFELGNRGAALQENLKGNGTKSIRSELRICSILSPCQAVTAAGPAAAKEWVYEQQNRNMSLETVVTGDTLETGHVPRCAYSGAVSDLSTRKAELVGGVSLAVLEGSQAPGTPLGEGNIPSSDLSQSSSLLRSILKKTPGRELMDSTKEYSNSASDRGGGESAAVSNCVKAFETLQAERTDSQSSKTPKKKKVTFGEVLSPEVFDQSLPANTPLRRGASPGCPQGQSLRARPGLSEEPLPLLDFGWDDEGVEPLPEFLEGSVAAGAPSPVENAEVAETDKPDMIIWSAKRKKTKYPSFGRRRKKKVKKSLYGEREMASKKPLLSPIPEIPEVFSSLSSPNSPKAATLSTEAAALGNPKARGACRDTPQQPQAGNRSGKLRAATVCPGLLEEAAASSSGPGDSEVPGSLEAAPGPAPEFSNTVLDAEGDFDTSEYFQQDKETPCEKEAKESSSMIEKEELQGNLLTGLEILERQDVQEAAQRTKCPQKDSVRGDSARRRRSSRAFFPPAENLEITGADLPVSSYNVEEFFSVPQAKEGSLQACRRSSASAEVRVRRSMRLSKDAASEGLAWIQLPSEIPKPSLPAAPKARRRFSTSILAGSENIHPREQNLLPLSAPGKENEGSAPIAAGPGRRWRRRSLFEATAREMPWAPTQRRRSTNSGCGKDRSHQKHLEVAETLELRLKDVSGISDFLK